MVIRQPIPPRKPNRNSEDKIKAMQLRRMIDIRGEELDVMYLYCKDYLHRKHIAFCHLACPFGGCNFFKFRRWLCIYNGECDRLRKCRSKKYWCKEMRKTKQLVDQYLELYGQWRKIKSKMARGQS